MELTLETSADVEYANINAEGNYRLSLPTSMRLENNKINNPFNYLTTASNYGWRQIWG
jgi:formylmethanofuran dehydrogenase subunit A